jgi:hypothetical protein
MSDVTQRVYLEPQRSYMWQIVLPSIKGGNAGATAELCQKVGLGNGISMETNKTREGAFTMTFLATNSDPVLTYFQAWFGRIVDGKSNYNPKSFYAFPVSILQQSTSGDKISEVVLKNAFPRQLSKSELDYEGERVVTWAVSFSVDRVEFL